MATKLFVVKESFVIEAGGQPVAYRKGEVIDPDDPIVKSHAAALEEFTFPHPVNASPKVEQATSGPGEKRKR